MLKVKTKQGQHVVSNLTDSETIGNLKSTISELTQIPADCLNVLIGFPPRPLDLSANGSSISTSGITSGDTLIVEEKQADPVPERNDNQQIEEDILLAQRLAAEEDGTNVNSEGILLKQVVPSDNSCLFTSIGEFKNKPLRVNSQLRASNRPTVTVITVYIDTSQFSY